MELGITQSTNIHNSRSLIRTLKYVLDILQTEEAFTVEEYKHTHTHTHTKSAVILRALWLAKVKVRNFSLLRFSRWLCLIHGQFTMSLRRVKKLVILNANISVSSVLNNGQFYLKYHFFSHRYFLLKETQLSVNWYVSILNFYSPKYWNQDSSLHL